MRNFCFILLLASTAHFAMSGCHSPNSGKPAKSADYGELASEIEACFRKNDLKNYFPRCVDNINGGFTASFSSDWTRMGKQSKFLVFQSRMTWLASQVAMRRPDLQDEYLRYSRHGLEYLAGKMWDGKYGGFLWDISEDGNPNPEYGTEKHAYGIAFAIFASSAAFRASGDIKALELAQKAFVWLDGNGHDELNGGYYESFTQEGKRILKAEDLPENMNNATGKTNNYDRIGTLYGYKSMNTHIHILEAFTSLYQVWPDKIVKARLEEMLVIVRDRIAVKPGGLNLYFTPDWMPIPEAESFGHDVETAYLLLEASEVLGRPYEERTNSMAKMLVDHALEFGFDSKNGGFFDKGSAFKPPIDTAKLWWVQAEGLNALLLMHELHGKTSDDYFQSFLKTWNFIRDFQIDSRYGGWFEKVDEDGVPHAEMPKSTNWKSPYHTGRALMTASERLRRMDGHRQLPQVNK